MNKGYICRLAIVFSVLAGSVISVHHAAGIPIDPPPPDPGAPLDGITRTVRIVESASEGIGRLFFRVRGQALTEVQPQMVMGIPTFILPFALQSGPVSCCALPDDTGSDTIVLGGQPNGTTFISLFSDALTAEGLPQPREIEDVTASDHGRPQHRTMFRIVSPLEPVPEPATLVLWGTTMAGLGLAARWRRRRQN
jgi:MYXO-CTERM domain-containing protein